MTILLALTLIVSLGYSECTGGLFSIPYTFASSAEEGTFDEALLMSMAPIECEDAVSRDQDGAEETKGCRDGESCLEQAARSATKQLALEEITNISVQEILPPVFLAGWNEDLDLKENNGLIRAGPLFEGSIIAARITVKRE